MTPSLQQALALHRAGHLDKAAPLYRQVVQSEPGNAAARQFFGMLRFHQGDAAEALALLDAALAINPYGADIHADRAMVLDAVGRQDEALRHIDRAIQLQPGDLGAISGRGMILRNMGRFDEALASFARVLARKPDFLDALYNHALLLQALGRHDAARRDFDRMLRLRPGDAEILRQRGRSFFLERRFEEAVASYEEAIAQAPGSADMRSGLGIVTWEWGKWEEAAKAFEAALVLAPEHPYAMLALAQTALYLCDWARSKAIAPKLLEGIAGGRLCVAPFIYFGYSADNAMLRRCAEIFLKDSLRGPVDSFPQHTSHDGKLRIAYLSCDYREHATAYLMAGLFESHDRARFEVIGVSLGPDDNSAIRARLIAGFDEFHDISAMSDPDAAALLHSLNIDIAIDINVYTQAPRPALLAAHPAPIQVNYLGYPGTSGAPFLDYIIADAVALPFAESEFYSEKIVHLPSCYQINDAKRPFPLVAPTRAEAGLPEDGLIFCCFNANWKITPEFFDTWARLLAQVEGSVLWLIAGEEAAANLRREAQARGIDPARLVFAPRVGLEAHLARHHLADLFLDTLPYNAHTTASDALWMELPLVTVRGQAFAGRVAASLLETIGVPDLIAEDLTAYEKLALALARDPAKRAALKARIAKGKTDSALFDTARITRDLEAAYEKMMRLHREGRAAESFAIKD